MLFREHEQRAERRGGELLTGEQTDERLSSGGVDAQQSAHGLQPDAFVHVALHARRKAFDDPGMLDVVGLDQLAERGRSLPPQIDALVVQKLDETPHVPLPRQLLDIRWAEERHSRPSSIRRFASTGSMARSASACRLRQALRAMAGSRGRRPPGVEVVYETHSISVDNERGVATGWLDGELSERGREGARALGERRRDDGIAAVYASDLGRAVETAEIAFADSDIPIHYDPRLRECNYGELNGMPRERLEGEIAAHVDEPWPGGESYRDVVERMRDFLDDLPLELDGARILLIAHAAPRWALDHLLAGKPLEDAVGAPFEWQEGWEYLFRRSDP